MLYHIHSVMLDNKLLIYVFFINKYKSPMSKLHGDGVAAPLISP